MTTLTFWLDVDNTLLDNDRVKEDLSRHLRSALGEALAGRFWSLYEAVRRETGVVNIPLAWERLRATTPLEQLDEQSYLHARSLCEHYPFFEALYPGVLETLAYLRTLGLTVIVSDGDQLFQAEKIVNSSLAEAVEGRVLIYDHKQRHLQETMQRYPADHYVAVDDRLDILEESKRQLGTRLTTVFVEQGKYALRAEGATTLRADVGVAHIADLRRYRQEDFLGRPAQGDLRVSGQLAYHLFQKGCNLPGGDKRNAGSTGSGGAGSEAWSSCSARPPQRCAAEEAY